jgi:ferritin
MLPKIIQDAISAQIHHEFYSSYLYLAMSAYCESINLPGCAKWLRVQNIEEDEHAIKFYNYVHSRNGKIVLQALEQPPVEFGTPLDLFTMVLEHEQKVTASINRLYDLAVKEADYPTQVMLHWFINEQVEEEKNATDIIAQLKMAGDAPVSIMMMDRALGMRAKK